jgi:transcriptional regulator with GAF, ATPase, and Fis domain
VKLPEVGALLHKALAERELRRENQQLRQAVEERYSFGQLLGKSAVMQRLFALLERLAATQSTVLILGESGTGKELVARALHYHGPRRRQPFVPVHCAAMSEGLLESELFGHVKGSFTGAVANKRGMFEVADGGTLFLDEIGNIGLSTQAKLLRVIQEREFRAVGDTHVQTANFRLIAATNKDLKALIAQGTFRDDLYYRINVFPIESPPLRERREDIPPLAFHFLKEYAEELGKKVDEISEGALNVLLNYPWPGNVRELENTMHRAVLLATDKVIRKAHLVSLLDTDGLPEFDVPRTGEELKRLKKEAREKSVEHIEKAFVLEALKRNGWNVTRSAESTGMLRANFQALMKKHGVRIREADRDGEAESSE